MLFRDGFDRMRCPMRGLVRFFVLINLLAGFVLSPVVLSLDPRPAAATSPSATPVTVKRAQYLMGTIAEITAVTADEATSQDAVTAGFQEIRRLEQLLSTWIESSELSRVNRAAGRDPVPVSPETFEVLQRAIEIGHLTGGAFDITIGPAVRLWKVTEAARIPSPMELAIASQYVDYRLVRLDPTARTAFLIKPGMQIDVGGIGKGFAAEKASAVMQRTGATGGVVAIAGDFRVFGKRADGSAWPIGIQHPRRPGAVLAVFDASDEAISTSGDYERFFYKDGVRYHHILDPRTLMPARLCQSVTIVAPDATIADALATGVFVMGPVRGLALVERLGVGSVIVDLDGRVTISSRLRPRIRVTH
jgi:thiamine biosynthesis lipoprotein